MRNNKLFKIVSAALLVAIEIIISRFLGIATPIVKISFSFIPLSILAVLYGPVYSCVGAGLADFIGAILFPIGPYFPGYTLTAALTGLTYGLFLYKRKNGWLNIILAVLMINLLWRLGLNSIWISMTTGKAMPAIMATRVVKTFITMPIEVILVHFVRERICPMLEKL